MSGREARSRFSGMRRQTSGTGSDTSRSRERGDTRERADTSGPRGDTREHESRSSRESSHQREVRCGCQYFQSDSLLPERQSLVGTRPSSRQEFERVSSPADMNGDHEYEPINPMASQRSPPPVMQVTDTEAAPASTKQQKKGPSARITYIDNDPNFIHIPLHGSDEDVADAPPLSYLQIPSDDKIVVSQDADADADIEDAQEFEDEDLSAQEIQNRMEERFFTHSPTTESRTDCEMNTSQIDSSALEDLPLKREARKAAANDSKSGFQQKIKSQAGRLRTKFRNLSKPKISLPDRPKFNLPDRPKFNLPDRPKFKMPERPKINLPDRPKFNFPDRPKFNLPDRPKFNMPQRPKISMPNFNLTKPRTSSSLRRPLRDRNQYHSSAQTTYGGKKNIFDTLNFRTYPRFFNKKKRIAEENARIRGRAMTPPPRMETDSIPSSPGSSKVPHTQTWGQKYRDIKFVDDENQSDKMSASLKAMSSFDDEVEDDMAEFRDQDFNGATSLDETKRKLKAISASSIQDSEKEQRSSGSSSDRHRKGVLEEIDSDEFFLRQKGLSREDVDVSRYLSLEIRDAFRSPQNALARMDTDPFDDEICEAEENLKKLTSVIQDTFKPELEEDEEEEEEEFERHAVEPKRPSRSRSLKSKQSTQSRSSLGRESLPDERENYKTYPPVRPSRKQSADKQSITTADIKDLDLDNESNESNEMNQVDLERVSIPNFEQQSFITQSTNETWAQAGQPPLPPKRRKSQKSLNKDSESMIDEVCPDDDWLDEVNAQLMVPGEITALQIETKAPTINIEQPTYDSPPVAPLRKSRSRATSLADEDRTSRGCDSLISEARSMPGDEFPVRRILSKEDDGNDMFGYATVEKPPVSKTLERPQRQKKNKPNRPPPPNRFNKKKATTQMMNLKNQGIHLKNQGINFFFTYPRRAMKSLNRDQQPPVRPVRNYSTIGPSRPPRRTKVFKEPVYAEGDNIPFMDESEKETIDSSTPKIQHMAEDEDDKPLKDIIDGDLKDLQSGDVIEKMKGRPLPAPPRPPRKSKTEDQLKESMNLADDEVCDFDDDEIVVSEKIDIQITRTPEAGRSRTDIDVQESEPGVDDTEPTTVQVEEVCTRVEEVVTTTAQVNKDQKQKEDSKTSPGKEVERVEVEKKEGPFAAFKEMISQKKREFFEPKKDKETSPTKQESSEQKTKVSREKSPIFKFIPLRSGSGQVEPQVEEANVSTQTDPLPEGYLVEEEQQTTTEENRTVSTSPPPSVSELKTDSVTNQQAPVQIQTVIEKRVVVAPDEETEVSFLKAKKLQVSELDVEKINVSELQANKISVSNIDGVSMQLSEISSKAGNLIVNGVELPPEFLQSLRQAASSQEGQTGATNVVSQPQSSETTDVPSLKIPPADSAQPPPVVVYPSQTPIIIYPPQMNSGSGPVAQQTISVHPAHITPFYGSGFEAASPTTTPLPRTRSPPRDLAPDSGSLLPVVKSSSGEEGTNPRPILPGNVDRPSAAHLTHELMLIGRDTLGDIISQIITGLNHYFPDGEKRRDAQTAVCIVLVLIAGLMLLGLGGEDKAVHHHHWDFFPPPR